MAPDHNPKALYFGDVAALAALRLSPAPAFSLPSTPRGIPRNFLARDGGRTKRSSPSFFWRLLASHTRPFSRSQRSIP